MKIKNAPKEEHFVYCGPNITGGILQRYTIYKGGLPSYLDDKFKQCASIRKLIVPVSELAKTEQAVLVPGTPEHTHYQEIMKYKGG